MGISWGEIYSCSIRPINLSSLILIEFRLLELNRMEQKHTAPINQGQIPVHLNNKIKIVYF